MYKSAEKSKIVICLKCKKKFNTKIDPIGIPYHRICKECKKRNFSFGRGVSQMSPPIQKIINDISEDENIKAIN